MHPERNELFDVSADQDLLFFRVGWRALAGTASLLAVGIAFFGLPLLVVALRGEIDEDYWAGYLSMTLLPLGLSVILAYVALRWRRLRVLDRGQGLFLDGRSPRCRLTEIDAVVIREVESEGSTNYEVFFYLQGDKRIKLTPMLRPFTRKEDAQDFAKQIADFLGVDVQVNYPQAAD